MAGPYLIAGGGWFAVASLVQWPPIRESLGLAVIQATMAWLIAAAGFAVHLAILIKRDRNKVENTSNRAINAAWAAIGFGIFAFWMGTAVMAYQRGDGFLMNTVSLQVLSVYGIGWLVAAAMTRRGWMKVTAFAAFATIPVLGAFVGTGQEFLIYAIALVLTAVVPGLRLSRDRRDHPRSIETRNHGLPHRRGSGRLPHAETAPANDRWQSVGSPAQTGRGRLRRDRQVIPRPQTAHRGKADDQRSKSLRQISRLTVRLGPLTKVRIDS